MPTETKYNSTDLIENKYKAVFENTGAATCIFDENSIILEGNEEFFELCAMPKVEILEKKSWQDFVHKDDLDEMLLYHHNRSSGEAAPGKYEFRFVDGKGNVKYIFLTIGIIPDTKFRVASLIDITNLKRSEALRLSSEEKFTKAFFSSPAIMSITSFETDEFIEVNNMFLNELEYKRSEVVGKTTAEINFFVDRDDSSVIRKELTDKGYLRGKEVSILSRKGMIKIVNLYCELLDYEGEKCILSVAIDVTNAIMTEAAYKESEKRYKNVVENATDAIFIIQDRKIRFLNKKASDLTGFPASELINKPIEVICPESEYKKISDNYVKLMTGIENNIRFTIKVKRKDCSIFDVELNNGTTTLNSRQAELVFMRDISNLKQDDEKIKRMNTDLEKSVADRTAQLKLTMDVLKKENQARKATEDELRKAQKELIVAYNREKEIGELKSRFISLISHEYRTPLTVIMSSNEIIKLLLQTKKYDEVEKHINKISNAINSMTSMVENVLSYNTLNTDEPDIIISKFDLVELIKGLVANVNNKTNNSHRIKLTVPSKVTELVSDKPLLKLALSNLLLNAIKFSPKDSEINVSLIPGISQIVISIKDEGSGISEKDLEHLFQPFFKAASSFGIVSGTGLGLAVVKKCIDALNGLIKVESELGKGSEFIVILPVN